MNIYILEPLQQVYILSSLTVLFGHILDITIDSQTLMEYMNKKTSLLILGTRSIYLNLFLISPLNYIIAYNFLLDRTDNSLQFVKLSEVLLTHNVMYYLLHYSVHKIKTIRFIHEFHHKFTTNIPSIGNAVSLIEFQTMYVFPFLLAMYLFNPNVKSLNIAVFLISFFNTLIHSSKLRNIKWFSIMVSPNQHGEHHATYSNTYSAPILNFDLLTHNIYKLLNNSKKITN